MFPPRPKHRIRPADLARYERQGIYVAQRKFNGTRTLIHISDGKVAAWRPGKTPHLQWSITGPTGATGQTGVTGPIANQFLSLNLIPNAEYWFDGELLHNKTTDPNYKDRVVLFDVLQAGEYLFGKPDLLGRYDLLTQICRAPTTLEPFHGIALQATENIWLAETFGENFEDRYQDHIDTDEIEGLVLKKKKSCLDNFGNKKYEVSWQLRCRKEHKNYSF
jgi:hypothetical protein